MLNKLSGLLALAWVFQALSPATLHAHEKASGAKAWTATYTENDGYAHAALEVAISQDGAFVAQATDDGVYVYQSTDGHLVKQLPNAMYNSLYFGGGFLFSGEQVLDLKTLELVKSRTGQLLACADCSCVPVVVGPTTIVGRGEKDTTLLYDWSTQTKVTLPGKWTTWDRGLLVHWLVDNDSKVVEVTWARRTSPQTTSSFKLPFKNDYFPYLRFAGGRAILQDEQSGGPRVWDIATRRKLAKFPEDLGTAAHWALSGDGALLAVPRSAGGEGRYKIEIWNTVPARLLSVTEVKLVDKPKTMRFDGTGKTLLGCDGSGGCVILRKK
jgi:hypothetical protein